MVYTLNWVGYVYTLSWFQWNIFYYKFFGKISWFSLLGHRCLVFQGTEFDYNDQGGLGFTFRLWYVKKISLHLVFLSNKFNWNGIISAWASRARPDDEFEIPFLRNWIVAYLCDISGLPNYYQSKNQYRFCIKRGEEENKTNIFFKKL